MAENKINYLNRNYDDYKNSLTEITRLYYNDIFNKISDASIGSWFIDMLADVGDTLNYAIDRSYQETNINSCTERSSLLQIAKNNGVKVPGPKSAIVEIELSCYIPMNNYLNNNSGNNLAEGDNSYCPYIKKGSLFSNGTLIFELMDDVDFSTQFDYNGFSNRQIFPVRDSNGNIVNYHYKKLALARAGQSKIMKRIILSSDIKPFMTIALKDSNILNVESIILKQGTNLNDNPMIDDFYVDEESYEDRYGKPTQRFFEVDNLIDQYRFGYVTQSVDNNYYSPIWDVIDAIDVNGQTEPIRYAMRGKWKHIKNKFITEFTDNNQMKITFGPGLRNSYGEIPEDASEFTKWTMSKMEANDYMGVLPEPNTTMYILYRIGGGEQSNIAPNTLTNILYLNMNICGNSDDSLNSRKKASVKNSLTVTNTTSSYGGKNSPDDEELKYIIKYNASSQNRCVTINDYKAKIYDIEPKYGIPFRFSVSEENNKIIIYTLGLDYNGKLSSPLSETVAENMKEYLSKFRMINDFVEIRSGSIINLKFEVDVFIEKSYDKSEVAKRIIEKVYDYMDIRKHQMGEDIFLGDLEKEISKLDGVLNFIDLRCYNQMSDGYSSTQISQDLVKPTDCDMLESGDNLISSNMIDLKNSDKILFSENSCMFEIKYLEKDISVNVKTR